MENPAAACDDAQDGRSLTESGMVTFANKVKHDAQGIQWNSTTQQYPLSQWVYPRRGGHGQACQDHE